MDNQNRTEDVHYKTYRFSPELAAISEADIEKFRQGKPLKKNGSSFATMLNNAAFEEKGI